MKGVRTSIICSLGALAVLAALWGCNGSDIDDPDKSDSLLIVDNVSPSSVQAKVSGTTDPNTMVVTPPPDDEIDVEVRNMNRTQAGSTIYGDIVLESFELTCALGTLTIGTGSLTGPVSLTIQAESSATISIVVATGGYKLTNSAALLGSQATFGDDRCEIVFHGQDLSGEPILSKSAVFGISYVN